MRIGNFKHIDGIQWAADVLTGQRQFPSFNKIEPSQKETDDDFSQVLDKACEELRLLREKMRSS